jgi:CDGSH-type Zn-finger protein
MADFKQKSPFQVELVEGQAYRFCTCGRSRRQPFCDDSHAGTGKEPLTFVARATETANLCGCKETDDPPYCDGTHNIL